jgi:pilus assembly protein Flp/PilA
MRLISRFMVWVREEKGQTMAEYGLILALVAVVVITAITLLGGNISAFFTDLAGNF